MNDKDFESVNRRQEKNKNFNYSGSFFNFFRRNRTATLAGIGTVCLVGSVAYLHQQGFFEGNRVSINSDGFNYEPEHTVKVKTGDNESKTEGIDNFSVGTNPSLESGNNTAEKNINNIAIDKDVTQNVIEFLSTKRNGK